MNLAFVIRNNTSDGFGHISRVREFIQAILSIKLQTTKVTVIVDNGYDNKHFELLNKLDFREKVSQVLVYEGGENTFESQSQFDFVFFDCLSVHEKLLSQLLMNSQIAVSISPIFEYNSLMKHIFSRGPIADPEKIDSESVSVHQNSKFSVFRNLKICKADVGSNVRLIFHIGGLEKEALIMKLINGIDSIKRNKIFSEIIVFLDGDFPGFVEEKNLDNFEFQITDIIITSGGLSYSEGAFSGLRTVNFYLNELHRHLADKSLDIYPNVSDIGVFEDSQYFFQKVNQAILMLVNDSTCISSYKECEGIRNILKEVNCNV